MLNGMTRVRGFTQDDAISLSRGTRWVGNQAADLVIKSFRRFRHEGLRVRSGCAIRFGPIRGKRDWDRARSVSSGAKTLGVPYAEEPGEAAFYGPKIDFVVRDVIGREWQLGTVQVDFQLPVRFDLHYTGADNKPHRPVMIHRAPFGSMERFVGVLIEHFAGAFPVWLAPEQARVLPISEKVAGYAGEVAAALRAAGVRAAVDSSQDKLGAKIRLAQVEKVP